MKYFECTTAYLILLLQTYLNLKSYRETISTADERGVNAMSISDITGIPRPTVVRKLKFLIDNDFLTINEKKLITLNLKNKALKITEKIQNANIRSFSDFTFRVFNQIKIKYSNQNHNPQMMIGHLFKKRSIFTRVISTMI